MYFQFNFLIIPLLVLFYVTSIIVAAYRKKYSVCLKLISLPFIITGIHWVLNNNRIQIDGNRAELGSFFFGEDTRYAPDYSHKSFCEIKVGMSKNQVLSLVGEPLVVFHVTEGVVGYKYSVSDSDTNYRLRVVHFKNEKVVEIIKEFYLD